MLSETPSVCWFGATPWSNLETDGLDAKTSPRNTVEASIGGLSARPLELLTNIQKLVVCIPESIELVVIVEHATAKIVGSVGI